METSDRPAGIFTRKQRRYLLGKSDIESGTSAERMMRKRIRQRIPNALLDVAILNDHITREDLIQAIQADEHEDVHPYDERIIIPDVERVNLTDGIPGAIPELVVLIWSLTNNPSALEAVIETGIEESYARNNDDAILTDVDVDITIRADVRETLVEIAEMRMQQGKDLSQAQITALLESEDHSDEMVGEYIRSSS